MSDERYRSFLFYRLPGENQIHSITELNIRQIDILEVTSVGEGFVLFPFEGRKGFLITRKTDKKEPESVRVFPPYNNETTKEEYLKNCSLFIDEIKKGNFSKLVLSKVKIVGKKGKTNKEIFHALCWNHQNAFVYHLHLPFVGEWLGASPELLLNYKNGQLKTVALAGTQKLQGDPHEIIWKEKEKKEQQLVSDFIEDTFAKNKIVFEKGETKTVSAGTIAHLKTEFLSTIAREKISSLLNDLHPTPAVCGIEKEKARQFISDTENHSRKYYTGFLGNISGEEINLFVNLRCMQVHKNCFELFTGGGITADSDPEKEWEETEMKAMTLGKYL